MTIYIGGDLHGSVADIRQMMTQINSPSVNDIIIVCGDAGLEYGNHIMGSCKKIMAKFPGIWIIMRGNHDNRYWKNHTHWIKNGICQCPDDGWEINEWDYLVQKKFPNIWYVQDEGGIYNINGNNFLFIPGAYSVDKHYRLQNNLAYEPNEQLTYQEIVGLMDDVQEFKSNGHNIDYVISHTAPMKLEPYFRDLFLGFIPQNAVDKNMEKALDQFTDMLEPTMKAWYFGHFHSDRDILGKYHMLFNTIHKIEKEN